MAAYNNAGKELTSNLLTIRVIEPQVADREIVTILERNKEIGLWKPKDNWVEIYKSILLKNPVGEMAINVRYHLARIYDIQSILATTDIAREDLIKQAAALYSELSPESDRNYFALQSTIYAGHCYARIHDHESANRFYNRAFQSSLLSVEDGIVLLYRCNNNQESHNNDAPRTTYRYTIPVDACLKVFGASIVSMGEHQFSRPYRV